jgi:hypothetical protein
VIEERTKIKPMSERACGEWLKKEMAATSPAHMDAVRRGWDVVYNEIAARASAARPKPKSYEVYHETVVAQCTYITALTVTSINTAQNEARFAVGLPETPDEA